MTRKNERLAANTELRGILRRVGLKATSSRLAILRVIKKTKKPLSAQDIIERLGKGFDQTTVYRFMKTLSRLGIIRQVDLRQNHAHFEFFDLDDHHHLVCIHCGRIENVTGCGVEDMHKTILGASKTFCDIRQHSLEFYGVCKQCIKVKDLSL